MEYAQVIWQRSVSLAGLPESGDVSSAMLDLLRAARHDASMLSDALALGHSRAGPGDETANRAIRLLQRAVAFLGVRPEALPAR